MRYGIIIVVFIISLVGCEKSEPLKLERADKVEPEDRGNWVSEKRYENASFGISFEAPADWVLKKDTGSEAVERALKAVKNADEAVKLGIASKHNPFWVYKEEPSRGSNPMNASLQAEPIPVAFKGWTSAQIAMKQREELAAISYITYPSPVEEVSLNGLKMSKQILRSEKSGEVKFQQQYFTLSNGFLIIYGITYPEGADEVDIDMLEKAIGIL